MSAAQREIEALRRYEYDWRKVDTLAQMLAAVAGKTVERAISHEDEEPDMFAVDTAVVLFTDGTGLALQMNHGWGGTEITPGTPASVDYYVLTRKVRP